MNLIFQFQHWYVPNMCTLSLSLHTSFRYMCNLRYINLDRINVTKDLEPLKTTRNCTTLIIRSNFFRSLSKSYSAHFRVTMGCLTYFLLLNMYYNICMYARQFCNYKGPYKILFLSLALLYNRRNGEDSFRDAEVYYRNLLINS